LITSARIENLSDILRDFKKFTSKKIISAIEKNASESRRDWMLAIFKSQAAKNSHNTSYQFWRQDNQPMELYSPSFDVQKLNYVHDNPVEAGLVDYLYSSARSYVRTGQVSLLDVLKI
jgi:hypothetical protein